MILTVYGRYLADIAGPLSEADIDLYKIAGRIVGRRFRTIRRYQAMIAFLLRLFRRRHVHDDSGCGDFV